MDPKFFDRLNLRNNSRTVRAGGPCEWAPDDVWAEITVTITQGSVVGSSSQSTRVYKSRGNEWWLDATSPDQFTPGQAQPNAVAIVHKTNNTTEQPYSWSNTVSNASTVQLN